MKKFVRAYMEKDKMYRVLEVGSREMPDAGYAGGNRGIFALWNKQWQYDGLDVEPGKNVDIVSPDPYKYPIDDNTYDIVISSQVMEHVPNLHAFIKECGRVLKPGGIMCMIAPFRWGYHPYPLDCWRIYPDGMRFLLTEIAGLEVLDISMARTDTVAVARKREVKEDAL